jgi:transcriptional regulator with XRE-family HTH domain
MDKLGGKIKELRLQKNISQEGLAQGICNRSLISRIENENVIPSAEILHNISLKLGISLEELFRYVQYSNYEYLKDFMHFTRKAVERRDYEEVKHILKITSTSHEFQTGIAKAFVLWHQGIITNYVYKDPLLAHRLLQEALEEFQQTKHSDGKAMEVLQIHLTVDTLVLT